MFMRSALILFLFVCFQLIYTFVVCDAPVSQLDDETDAMIIIARLRASLSPTNKIERAAGRMPAELR